LGAFAPLRDKYLCASAPLRALLILDRQQVELPQRVDRLDLAFVLDVPEGPAVAARRALQRLADAVDRAGLAPADDRAVGAHGGGPAALLVEQLGAGGEEPRL